MKLDREVKKAQIAIKRRLEDAYNLGFKEYTYDESLKKAKLIQLANSKVVDAEELKKNLSDVLDAIVAGEVEEVRFNLLVNGYIDFAMRIKGQTKVADLRLGKDERTKS